MLSSRGNRRQRHVDVGAQIGGFLLSGAAKKTVSIPPNVGRFRTRIIGHQAYDFYH